MLITGGVAANHWFPSDWSPNRIDLDVICTFEEAEYRAPVMGKLVSYLPNKKGSRMIAKYSDRGPIEFEIAWAGSSAEAILAHNGNVQYASPLTLLMMKESHKYLRNSPHFWKTMRDVHTLRGLLKDYTMPGNLKEIQQLREKETYDYSHPNLKQSKQDFFNGDGVDYVYDHDLIHEFVKYNHMPAYKFFAEIGEEVKSSKHMFFNDCSELIRLHAVLEESMVLAIERSLIPHPGVLTPKEAFIKALEKVCSSITSGWFREYAWENAYTILDLYNEDRHKIAFERLTKCSWSMEQKDAMSVLTCANISNDKE